MSSLFNPICLASAHLSQPTPAFPTAPPAGFDRGEATARTRWWADLSPPLPHGHDQELTASTRLTAPLAGFEFAEAAKLDGGWSLWAASNRSQSWAQSFLPPSPLLELVAGAGGQILGERSLVGLPPTLLCCCSGHHYLCSYEV
jgi:hypothetical protein